MYSIRNSLVLGLIISRISFIYLPRNGKCQMCKPYFNILMIKSKVPKRRFSGKPGKENDSPPPMPICQPERSAEEYATTQLNYLSQVDVNLLRQADQTISAWDGSSKGIERMVQRRKRNSASQKLKSEPYDRSTHHSQNMHRCVTPTRSHTIVIIDRGRTSAATYETQQFTSKKAHGRSKLSFFSAKNPQKKKQALLQQVKSFEFKFRKSEACIHNQYTWFQTKPKNLIRLNQLISSKQNSVAMKTTTTAKKSLVPKKVSKTQTTVRESFANNPVLRQLYQRYDQILRTK